MSVFAEYFSNLDRPARFPWSLYHAPIDRQLAEVLRTLPSGAKVMTVGCGLSPLPPGGREDLEIWAADLDPRSIETCQQRYPHLAARIGASPGPYALPENTPPLDCIIAKEVIEHTDDPIRFLDVLLGGLREQGHLLISTPNYDSWSLKLIERSLLELIARADGYSRRHIHPTPLSVRALIGMRVAKGELVEAKALSFGWVAFGHWRRLGGTTQGDGAHA